jgi:catechol 2,3-dioxygenase-like lactoylglutathione lyase family enzyme
MSPDVGLTHVALPVCRLDESISFYERYAGMTVVHRRRENAGAEVAWVSDRTRPFVLVLLEVPAVEHPLRPSAHLGVGCASREEVDRLCALARGEGRLVMGPTDSGWPVGYWALISDPDGHTLEVSHGQEIGLAVEGAAAGAGNRS